MSRQRHLAVSGRSVNQLSPKRKATRTAGAVTNANLAELLALEAAKVGPPLNRAFRRASRRAFLWPEEAKDIVRRGGSLAELQGIGPYLERTLQKWIANPPSAEAPPPLRSGFLTLTQAQSILDSEPHWLPDVNGDLQMHTLWSDGSASIADMAAAGIEHGYDYIAITDHAKALKIAGGIDEQQLRRQAREIETVNDSLARARQKLRVLHSIELNLSPAGEGDMEPAALAHLDIVIGCFHSSLRRKEEQTARYLAALNNPAIQILGHPRGRIYNYRIGLCADWPRVFDMAAELDKAIEIDAYPDRQDLSPDLLVLARKAGCHISFGTDSHGPSQLRFMAFAAASALQAGIKRERVLNFMSRDLLLAWVRGVRDQSFTFERKVSTYGKK
jgi:histidinol phosphatase-like PHP family hydrolase